MGNFKEFWVDLIICAIVMLVFFLFVGLGWPGKPDTCVDEGKCYCESFVEEDIGKPGVRQPANTWSNLFPLVVGLVLALVMGIDRSKGGLGGGARMNSETIYPMIYCAVVSFMGPGSMFFHASLTRWGGVVDNLSMYLFSNFLLCYAFMRVFDNDLIFYILYPVLTVGLTIVNAFIGMGWLLVILTAAPGVIIEIILIVKHSSKWFLFAAAGGTFILALIIWLLSNTGGPLCSPESWIQAHAIWHILACIMTAILFFHYRLGNV